MNPIFWTILYVVATILCFYKKICLEPKGERLDCLKDYALGIIVFFPLCLAFEYGIITTLLLCLKEFFIFQLLFSISNVIIAALITVIICVLPDEGF